MGRMAKWGLRAEKRKVVKEGTNFFFLCWEEIREDWEALMSVCVKEIEKEKENDKKEG